MSAVKFNVVCALLPTGDAEIRTVRATDGADGTLGAGAVYTVEARPSLPVTIVRAASVPKSTCDPSRNMSTRSVTPPLGWPFASIALTTIDDWDCPSRRIVLGVAVTVIDVAKSDGPVSGGGPSV